MQPHTVTGIVKVFINYKMVFSVVQEEYLISQTSNDSH